jgi:predicted DNA binding CopG/RHH family protein
MKYFELEKNEEGLLKEFEAGAFKRVKDARSTGARYRQYAKHTLNKTRNINIRLPDKDLQKIKTLAAEKGLPYQTFISSLLHQYSSGRTEVQ